MAGGQGRSSPDRLPRGERTSPLGGARQWGEQGEAAQTFCTFGPVKISFEQGLFERSLRSKV